MELDQIKSNRNLLEHEERELRQLASLLSGFCLINILNLIVLSFMLIIINASIYILLLEIGFEVVAIIAWAVTKQGRDNRKNLITMQQNIINLYENKQ